MSDEKEPKPAPWRGQTEEEVREAIRALYHPGPQAQRRAPRRALTEYDEFTWFDPDARRR
jgi:hypothetical protein